MESYRGMSLYFCYLYVFNNCCRFTEDNAKVWNNVGHALEAEGKYVDALTYFQTAARLVCVLVYRLREA